MMTKNKLLRHLPRYDTSFGASATGSYDINCLLGSSDSDWGTWTSGYVVDLFHLFLEYGLTYSDD